MPSPPRSAALRGLCAAVLLFSTGAAGGAALAAHRGDGPALAVAAAGDSVVLPPPQSAAPRATSARPGTFTPAGTGSPVRGSGGRLHRYHVSVENVDGADAAGFADAVDAVFADPRGWPAGGTVRLQRVVPGEPADFTVYLATPATSEAMCATGGLQTRGYSSCRLPGKVVINLARWLTAVPHYGAPLAEYRNYVVNHEVGHQLGYGHESCPGRGRPAPVMQQQTNALNGCVAHGWPYRDGRRYRGG